MQRPAMTRVHLVRHGEVHEDWRGRIYGQLDVPLSDRGHDQSRRIAAAFEGVELACVASSGLVRAETAAAFLRRSRVGLERRDDARFREVDRGAWAGLTLEEVESHTPGGLARWIDSGGLIGPPAGETILELAQRVYPALDELAAAHEGAEVAVVAHLWVVRAAICEAIGLPLERSLRLVIPPGGMATLAWSSTGTERRTGLAGMGLDRLARSDDRTPI